MTGGNENSTCTSQSHAVAGRTLLLQAAFSAALERPESRSSLASVLHVIGPLVEDKTVKRRILIADDEARVLLILHDSLKKLGERYEIATALNGREALQLALDGPFDLVITDLRMPGLGGIELARRVKAARPDTEFIWITAYGCHNVAEECAHLGILACLDKPLEIREIRTRVREALHVLDEEGHGGNGGG